MNTFIKSFVVIGLLFLFHGCSTQKALEKKQNNIEFNKLSGMNYKLEIFLREENLKLTMYLEDKLTAYQFNITNLNSFKTTNNLSQNYNKFLHETDISRISIDDIWNVNYSIHLENNKFFISQCQPLFSGNSIDPPSKIYCKLTKISN